MSSRKSILLLLLVFCTGLVVHQFAGIAAEPQSGNSSVWRQRAWEHVQKVADAHTRGEAAHELAYILAREGDFETATAAAALGENLQKRLYAYTFVASQQRSKGDDQGTAKSLALARQTAIDANGLREAESFINPHLISAYAEAGRVNDALEFARSLHDRTQRNLAITYVAGEMAKAGDLASALNLVDETAPGNWRQNGLAQIAQQAAQERRIGDVQKTVDLLTDASSKDAAWARLVTALVEKERLDEAADAAAKITGAERQGAARAEIAAAREKIEDPAKTAERIASATSRDEKVALYSALAQRHAEAGEVAEAERAIEGAIAAIRAEPRPGEATIFGMMTDEAHIARAQSLYLYTAIALASQGQQTQALNRIQMVKEAVLKLPPQTGLGAMLLVPQIVAAQTKVGDLRGAQQTVAELEPGFSRSEAAARVAAALAKAGDSAGALKQAELINDPRGKAMELGGVGAALIEADDLSAAKQLAGRFGESAEETAAFRLIGRAMIAAGREEEFEAWLTEMPSDLARAYAAIGAAEAR